ncbi:hypothetical protein ASD52_04765 [Ensifer sp. Root142]|uniref:ABC transporter permease n=1 Tax=Ensifer sp. Root142 TaxID=1736461 RepID=UPI00070DFB36|nr:ABC transporter permease [Ensifer sp. Root142]KQY79127.1 hypothetical protein ASD52_04765 [Ensifer sp. Root142]
MAMARIEGLEKGDTKVIRLEQESVKTAVARQLNVMHAVILRDIRSRYFNHGLGFLMVPLMPVAHIVMLLVWYKTMNRAAAYGDDLVLFFATGLIPSLTACYVSRYMSVSVLANKNMLGFPAVHLLDIILARSLLEIFGMLLSVAFLLIIIVSLGTDPFPGDTANAGLAMVSAILIGVGVGINVSVITAIYPFFATIYALFTALIYITSGGPIFLHTYPEQVINIATYNPVFHAVEWMRSSYYTGYSTQYLSKGYVIGWGIGSVALGLLMERLLRPQVMNG